MKMSSDAIMKYFKNIEYGIQSSGDGLPTKKTKAILLLLLEF